MDKFNLKKFLSEKSLLNEKCEIITMTSDLWKKIDSLGKNLETFSLETVQMFLDDALDSKFEI